MAAATVRQFRDGESWVYEIQSTGELDLHEIHRSDISHYLVGVVLPDADETLSMTPRGRPVGSTVALANCAYLLYQSTKTGTVIDGSTAITEDNGTEGLWFWVRADDCAMVLNIATATGNPHLYISGGRG